MTGGLGCPEELRSKLALALDVADLEAANQLALNLKPWFGVVKIGLELYSAVGPGAVAAMREIGYDVFLDLKLHDIPNTVGGASRVVGALGVKYLTLHTCGGLDMLRAGVEGLVEGSAIAGLEAPIPLGVTVLTSDKTAPTDILKERVQIAIEAGCGGLVCAAKDLKDALLLAPGLVRVVPGIRPTGVGVDDQASVATPAEALAGGADVLVIGRAVTGAKDPCSAADDIARELLR